MNIEVINNIPTIYINKNRLSAMVELNENKSIYTDRVGFLENDFTPQQLNSINARTKDLVYNRVINDTEMRNKAFRQLENNINELLRIECKYIISEHDVIQNNNEITINN